MDNKKWRQSKISMQKIRFLTNPTSFEKSNWKSYKNIWRTYNLLTKSTFITFHKSHIRHVSHLYVTPWPKKWLEIYSYKMLKTAIRFCSQVIVGGCAGITWMLLKEFLKVVRCGEYKGFQPHIWGTACETATCRIWSLCHLCHHVRF